MTDNSNQVERSELIMATTIHDKSPEELIKHSQLERVQTFSQILFK